MSNLLSSWRDSLSLLKPGTFKLLGLATLNAWIKAWKVGWGILLILVVAQHILPLPPILSLAYTIIMIGYFIAAARPSIGRKDAAYFARIFRDYLVIITVFVLPLAWLTTLVLTSSFLYFFMLFMFDSVPWSLWSYARAVRNTVMLIVYNMPLVFILGLFETAILALIAGLLMFVPVNWLSFLFIRWTLMILASLFICLWVNIYTKRVHDDPPLYTYE